MRHVPAVTPEHYCRYGQDRRAHHARESHGSGKDRDHSPLFRPKRSVGRVSDGVPDPVVRRGCSGRSHHTGVFACYVEVRESTTPEEAEELYSSVLWRSLVFLSAIAVVVALIAGTLLHWIASGFSPQKIALDARHAVHHAAHRAAQCLQRDVEKPAECGGALRCCSTHPGPDARYHHRVRRSVRPDMGHSLDSDGNDGGSDTRNSAAGNCRAYPRAAAVSPWRNSGSASRRVFLQYVPVASSNVIMGGSSVVDQMMAATLGSGSVSALNYGTRLVGVIWR